MVMLCIVLKIDNHVQEHRRGYDTLKVTQRYVFHYVSLDLASKLGNIFSIHPSPEMAIFATY